MLYIALTSLPSIQIPELTVRLDKILILVFSAYPVGWGQILECINFTHFPINWILRSFKCIEISLLDQTPGAETPSKVCVWTNESRAQNQLKL